MQKRKSIIAYIFFAALTAGLFMLCLLFIPSTAALADETAPGETDPQPGDYFPAEAISIPLASPFTYGVVTEDMDLFVVNWESANVRKAPGTENPIGAKVRKWHSFQVLGEDKDSEGKTWYKVLVEWEGENFTGYIAATMGSVTRLSAAGDSYENYLTLLSFPPSYTARLKEVHAQYPRWFFIPNNTGLDWSYVLSEEANPDHRVGISLISISSPSSHKSTRNNNYDWYTNTWKAYDSGGWTLASDEIVAYYLDPRNFIGAGDDRIFLFLNLSFDGSQTVEGIRALVKGSFMEEGKARYGETFSYPEVLYQVGQQVGVSPYYLAASIRQEVGSNGSGSVSGTTRYGAIYNYYNIQAYARNGLPPMEAGLDWASQRPSGSNPYDRPWNERQKALLGGAKYFAYNYVDRGQNTLYLKKFNVMGGFTHQYMTNVTGAASEAKNIAKAYDSESRGNILSFDIPIYTDMPAEPCPQPTGNGSPNNRLRSISLGDQRLDCLTDIDKQDYVAATNRGTVNISAQTLDSKATVEGLGNIKLTPGDNNLVITVKAENGALREYRLNVYYQEDVNGLQTDYKLEDGILSGIEPGTKLADFLEKIKAPDQSSMKMLKADGSQMSSGDVVGTGNQLILTAPNGSELARYSLLIYGDVNGDGVIDIFDYVGVRNHIIQTSLLEKLKFMAGDINSDGSVDVFDLVGIRNHIIEFSKINQ